MRNIGLEGVLGDLIPLVEFTWSSPASTPSAQPTRWTAAPGIIYMANWGEVGAVALVHFFFDDLFPTSIGKPLFP